MSTVEPHTPAPGWFTRWIVQSVQLLPRMGAPAAALVASMFVVGAVALGLEAALTAALGSATSLVQDLAILGGVVFATPFVLIVFALIIQADRGVAVDWAHLRTLLPTGFVLFFVVGLGFMALGKLVFGGWNDLPKPLLTFAHLLLPDDSHWALVAVFVGCHTLSYALLVQSIVATFASPFVLGLNATWGPAHRFDTVMGRKMPRVYHTSYTFIFAVGLLSQAFVGLGVGLLGILFLFVWMNVAARELVGGIRSNGKVTTAAATPVAQPHTQG